MYLYIEYRPADLTLGGCAHRIGDFMPIVEDVDCIINHKLYDMCNININICYDNYGNELNIYILHFKAECFNK